MRLIECRLGYLLLDTGYLIFDIRMVITTC